MEPYLAYFQSQEQEFFATVVGTKVAPDGTYLVVYKDDKNVLCMGSLVQYKVTRINPANRQHFEERLRDFSGKRNRN